MKDVVLFAAFWLVIGYYTVMTVPLNILAWHNDKLLTLSRVILGKLKGICCGG